DFADRVDTGQQGHDAVPAEGDAAVRGRAELEGLEQEAELLRRLLFGDAHDLEHALLDVPAVDADRTAADLVSVAHDVVGIGQGRTGIRFERVEELGLGRGERVMDGRPGASPTATSPAACASA